MAELGLLALSIEEVAPKIKGREVSPVEVTIAAIEHAERMQPKINSFITFVPEMALARAHELESALMRGEYCGPLHGIPIGVKDNIHIKGIPTKNGTKSFGAVADPMEDAPAVGKLREAGAIVIGKENMPESACNCVTDNAIFGYGLNPWDTDCHPGGSSGGTAANVAAYVTYGGVGTDGGGSVRMPASYNGVAGMKATCGRVSQRGNTIDPLFGFHHIGPLSRTVKDNAMMLQAVSEYDHLDSTSEPVPVDDYVGSLSKDIRGLVMGIPRQYFFDHLDPEVRGSVEQAIKVIEGLGVKTEEVSVKHMELVMGVFDPAWVDIAVAVELHLWTQRDEFDGNEILRYQTLLAQCVPAVALIKVGRFRRVINEEFAKVMERVDFLVTPTTPTPAYPYDLKSIQVGDHLVDLTDASGFCTANMPLTCVFNFIGPPAISIPCGFSSKGLPIGLQIIGRVFEESLVLRVADSYQRAAPRPKELLPKAVEEALAEPALC